MTKHCPINTGLFGSNPYCDKCTDVNCDRCEGSATNCVLCKAGYY